MPVRPGASSPRQELGPCSLFHVAFSLSRGGKTPPPIPLPEQGFCELLTHSTPSGPSEPVDDNEPAPHTQARLPREGEFLRDPLRPLSCSSLALPTWDAGSSPDRTAEGRGARGTRSHSHQGGSVTGRDAGRGSGEDKAGPCEPLLCKETLNCVQELGRGPERGGWAWGHVRKCAFGPTHGFRFYSKQSIFGEEVPPSASLSSWVRRIDLLYTTHCWL